MTNKTISILCTLGPTSVNKDVVSRLDDLGVDVFRLNLSHTRLEDVARQIETLQALTNTPICLDTEGAQVRTGFMEDGKTLFEESRVVEIANAPLAGTARRICLNPAFVADELRVGDLLTVDFDSAVLLVCGTNPVQARVVSGGSVASNRAITIDRHVDLPVVSLKDIAAIRIGRAYGLKHFALSFANTGACVDLFRSLIGPDAFLISKIESRRGVRNLPDILSRSDAILIDRGDLSREEPIEKIPFLQKLIIGRANTAGVPVYVATNLLESMVTSKKPTRAETGDVINALLDGADGLVLAAETAIGAYPIQSAVMISKLVQQFHGYRAGATLNELAATAASAVVAPHGGPLVDACLDEPVSVEGLPRLDVGETVLMDAEQIGIGAFSPVRGFMSKAELDSVLDDYRMPDGTVWPMPITLQTNARELARFAAGTTIALTSKGDGLPYALLTIESVYRYDLDTLAQKMYGTTTDSHPGVKSLRARGDWFAAGPVQLIRRLPSALKHYEITPRQSRAIFENRGWSRVMAFHTRNVIHLAHEYVQARATEKFCCDGLFVHPVVGQKKTGDFTADIVMKSYELMLARFYPKGKVLLSGFQNYARYAGPREAVFTALCRKNFGCTHIVVGRDHTGVGSFYGPADSHRLFEQLGDIGIVPVFFDEVAFCEACGAHVETCAHGRDRRLTISGTEARTMLTNGQAPPDFFMRQDISRLVLEELALGREVFAA